MYVNVCIDLSVKERKLAELVDSVIIEQCLTLHFVELR